MKATVEYITPEQAQVMLKNNPNNRKLVKSRVEKMAAQMERGAWRPNGSTIVMNGDSLLDGQHRLNAIIRSGMTVPFVVVRDVEKGAFSTIDTGKARSFADFLAIRGEYKPAILAGAVRNHAALSKGFSVNSAYYEGDTYYELSEHLARHPEIRESVHFVMSLANRPPVDPSRLAACHAIFASKAPSNADWYVRAIVDGIGIRDGSPEQHVHSRLNSRAKGQQATLKPWDRIALVIHGWNAIQAGQIHVHHFKVGGKTKTGRKREFPVIQ